MAPKKTRTDWVGLWFRLMQERGQETRIRLGRIDSQSGRVAQWHDVNHWEVDGGGALTRALRERGLEPRVPSMTSGRVSWLAWLRGLVAYFKFMPVHGALWKT